MDHGFVDQWAFADPDGHIWDIGFMDMEPFMKTAAQGGAQHRPARPVGQLRPTLDAERGQLFFIKKRTNPVPERNTWTEGGGRVNDAPLFQRYEQDRETGIRLIIEAYKQPLYNYCRFLSRSEQEAEDLFQDVWVKVFTHLDRYDRTRPFANWLFAIASNTYKDKYRKAKRWLRLVKHHASSEAKERDMGRIPSSLALPEDEALQRERKARLRRAIASLKDDYKLPLVLYYFHDLPYREIAEILHLPEGTVKSRLHAAKNMLKQRMEASGRG